MTVHGVEHRYEVGQTVRVRGGSPNGRGGDALITRLEPYLGRPGYYVQWTDATEQWHCHGGWKPERLIIEVVS